MQSKWMENINFIIMMTKKLFIYGKAIIFDFYYRSDCEKMEYLFQVVVAPSSWQLALWKKKTTTKKSLPENVTVIVQQLTLKVLLSPVSKMHDLIIRFTFGHKTFWMNKLKHTISSKAHTACSLFNWMSQMLRHLISYDGHRPVLLVNWIEYK